MEKKRGHTKGHKKATQAQAKKINKLYRDAQNTPMVALTSAMALSGRDFASMAYERLYEYIDKCAIKARWPKSNKHYGFNTKTMEFISPEGRA